MTGDELTPERLDAILDGQEAASDDDARDMLALAATLREGSPGAPDELRGRVRALGRPSPAEGWLRRLLGTGRRGRILVAAPALGAALAAVIAIGVITNNPSTDRDLAAGTTTTPTVQMSEAASDSAAPPAAAAPATGSTLAQPPAGELVVAVAPATLDAAEAELRRIVTAAGGTVASATRTTSPAGLAVSITLPNAQRDGVIDAVARLGVPPVRDGYAERLAAAPDIGTETTLSVRLEERP